MATGFSTDEEAGRQDAGLISDVGAFKTEISGSKERARQFMEQVKNVPPSHKCSMRTGKLFKYFFIPLFYVGKLYIHLLNYVYKAYKWAYKCLPTNVISMIFGLGLCFCGGAYYTTIAAIEAFRQFGGEQLANELSILWSEAERAVASIKDASKEDSANDGIADFDKMTYHQRAHKTAFVAMNAVNDPMGFQKAAIFLFSSWLSVLGVLRFQFAKSVSLCLAVSEMLEHPFCRLLGPPISVMLGPDLNKWAYPSISVALKIIAVIAAHWLYVVINAIYSGLKGGKMFAEAVVNILTKQESKPHESLLDEYIAYPLAAAGFLWQLMHLFFLPLPMMVVLFPLTIVEWIIKIQILA